MATIEQIEKAAACLGVVYPQFAAKELAELTNALESAFLSITDPLAALADQSAQGIVDGVSAASEGDVFGKLQEAGAGLLVQYSRREAEDFYASMQEQYPEALKEASKVANTASTFINASWTALGLFPDMPYAGAQRICEVIARLIEMKIENLQCARKHVVQMVNLILVIARNSDIKTTQLSDLSEAKDLVRTALAQIDRSQILVNGSVAIDNAALKRANDALGEAASILSPQTSELTVLDAVSILAFDSSDTTYSTAENVSLASMVIPSMAKFLGSEAFAYEQHVTMINRYIQSLADIVGRFRAAGKTSRIQEQRARGIARIRARLYELCLSMEASLRRNSIRQASPLVIQYVSRIKSIIEEVSQVSKGDLVEGSIEGPAKAAELDEALRETILELSSLSNSNTEAGIEDPAPLATQLRVLSASVNNILEQLDQGIATDNTLANIHALAANTATAQVGWIDEAIQLANEQKVICEAFAKIDIAVRERYDELIDSANQLGFDRAADMFRSGKFDEISNFDTDSLSYLGLAGQCLNDAIQGIDDSRTRRQVAEIRDDIVARRAVVEIAAVNSSEAGLLGRLDKIQSDIQSVQKNTETVQAIYDNLVEIAKQAGRSVADIQLAISDNPFNDRVDRLEVASGGRLGGVLERFSQHARGGIVPC